MNISLENLPPLVCPLTKLPLEECSTDFLARINERIRQGEIRSVGGEAMKAPLEGALLRSDEKVAYPIVRGIPILIPEAGFPVIL